MEPTLLLVTPAGSSRDLLADAVAEAGGRVAAFDTGDLEGIAAAAGRCDAVVHLPALDPFESSAALAGGVAERVADAAASASARLLFCSSVLIYEDGGDAELTAGDPELDPPELLAALADAELDVFRSRAEVMVLRLGALLVEEGAAARSLVAEARRRPDGGDRPLHLPLLDPATLASTLVTVAGSGLHGGWDVVAACPTSAELFPFVVEASGGEVEVGPSVDRLVEELEHDRAWPHDAGDGPERPWVEHAWSVSRRVTGDALRGAGVPASREWSQFVKEAVG